MVGGCFTDVIVRKTTTRSMPQGSWIKGMSRLLGTLKFYFPRSLQSVQVAIYAVIHARRGRHRLILMASDGSAGWKSGGF